MTRKTLPLDDTLYEYLLVRSLDEPVYLRRLREETAQHPRASMQIAPEQGQFMHLLLRLMGARRGIEVGVFTGYSSIWSALALPPEGVLVGCDSSEEYTAVARRYWQKAGVEQKIRLALGPALETLDRLLADEGRGAYDFAFIDADKENYEAYYERCLELIRPGGLIMVDNVLWSGRVADPAWNDPDTHALRAFNAAVQHDERVLLSMVPIGDGLTLALKK